MAGNQREIERQYKREQKDKRNKLIIWIIIAVIILVLVVMKVCEININSIKDHFTDENGNFTLTEGVVMDNFPYSIDSSSNVTMVNANNKIGVLTPNSYTVLDSTDATADFFFEHGYSNPILANSGIYSLIYDQGANKYRLDTVSQNEYEEETENSILCADVSKNGTVAIATTSKEKLCDIYVYSRSLEKQFELSISSGYAVDIALSDNSRQVSVAVVNSQNAELITTIYTYNVNSDGSSEKAVTLPSGTLADISFTGGNILVVGTNYAGVVKKDGTYEDIYIPDSISTRCISYTPAGDLILVHNQYSNSTENVISYIKTNGKIKNEINISGNIKSVTASSSLVSVLTNSEIITFNLSNSEEKGKISTMDSVNSICRIGSEIFSHKQSQIERSEAENN